MAARNRRVVVIVALAALIAAAAVVGATLLQTRGEHTTVPGAVVKPRAGQPPLALNFGIETSAEARALTRAQALYNGGHVAQAAAIFARHRSLESQIGSAFAAWKQNGLATVRSLAAAHPASSVALLHLGIADYWAGQNADAVAEWEKAASIGADSPYGVKAEDLLHPTLKIPGLPYLVLDFRPPQAIGKLPPAEQLAALARAAAKGDRPGEAPVRLGALEPRAPGLGRAAVRGCGEARAARPARAYGRGRRRVHEGEPGEGVRPPRTAHRRLPALGGCPLPSRLAPALERRAAEGGRPAPARGGRRAELFLRARRARTPFALAWY